MPVQTRQQKRRMRAAQIVQAQPAAVPPARPAPKAAAPPPEQEERQREECAICLEPVGCCPYRLRCGHAFHGGCMREWISFSSEEARCPVCRGPIRPAPWQNFFENSVVAWFMYRLFLAWMVEGEA